MNQIRKLKRSVARSKMKLGGLERLNRKNKAGKQGERTSFFALNWRNYYHLKVDYDRRLREKRNKSKTPRLFSKRRVIAEN